MMRPEPWRLSQIAVEAAMGRLGAAIKAKLGNFFIFP
jgi:hypothetical protein